MKDRDRLKTLCAVLGIAAFALYLHWPALDAGLIADDYLQRAMLEGKYPIARAPWDLYSFFRNSDEMPKLMASGVLPWWMPPELRLSLLRPLTSLLVYLDVRVLGLSPRAEHVHSLLWLVAFIGAFQLLARRVLPRGAAILATVLVSFDVALVSPVAWLCNRAPLISATFGALALFFHHRFREQGSKRDALAALAAFSLSLLGGEYAIGVLAFVAGYELVTARDGFRRRLGGAALAFAPGLIYALFYVLFHYGASGGTVYIGPLDSPREFFQSALLRVPSLLANELLLLPGEAVYFGLLIESPLSILAFAPLAFVLVVIVWALLRVDSPLRRRAGAYALGVLLGLVPLCGTIPAVRLLLVPSMGGSLVLALVIWTGLDGLRDPATRRRIGSWIFALACVPLAALHLALSPWLVHHDSREFSRTTARLRAACYDSEIDDSRVTQQDLVLLNMPGDLVALDYPVWVRQENGSPMPRSWRTLTSALVPLRVLRVADDTLELVVGAENDAMFGYDVRRHENPENPFKVGQRRTLPGLEVEILEVHGWSPSRVRYRFSGSLDDGARELLRFEHGRLVRFPIPRVGQEAPLPVGFP